MSILSLFVRWKGKIIIFRIQNDEKEQNKEKVKNRHSDTVAVLRKKNQN